MDNARSEGTFTHKVENFSKLKIGTILSPPFVIRNLSWRMSIVIMEKEATVHNESQKRKSNGAKIGNHKKIKSEKDENQSTTKIEKTSTSTSSSNVEVDGPYKSVGIFLKVNI